MNKTESSLPVNLRQDRRLSSEALVEGVAKGDRNALSQAITFVESTVASHRREAQTLLSQLPARTHSPAKRVAITGIPGAGKSSFIEVLGNQLCDRGLRIAVLAVDPSSSLTGGSILGDKTRMETLSRRPECFIRPSPNSGELGGVTRQARDTIRLCEAAGFEVILIETVGVGQSEVAVRSLVDCLLLLTVPGTGDAIQGMKRGIVELADVVAVNKADGENRPSAESARLSLEGVMEILSETTPGWRPPVLAVSALEQRGVAETWQTVDRFFEHLATSGLLDSRRRQNRLDWFRSHIADALHDHFRGDPKLAAEWGRIETAVASGSLDVTDGMDELIRVLCPPPGSPTSPSIDLA